MPFRKLLIANRGEIAIRIARAAADAGLATVAIYPADDAMSLHVRIADESRKFPGAVRGPISILKASSKRRRRWAATRCIPAMDFSENAELASRCGEEGITFVGPSPSSTATVWRQGRG